MSEYYIHLKDSDYEILFPDALDVVPVQIQKRTFVDDFFYNMMYACLLNIETFLINNKACIEAE